MRKVKLKSSSAKSAKSWPLMLLGTAISGAWLLGLHYLIPQTSPCTEVSAHTRNISDLFFSHFKCLEPNQIGDFLAGVFAPLAFLWLVLTVILQSRELAAQRDELHLATEAPFEQAEFTGKHVEILEGQQQITLLEAAANSIGFRLRTNKQFATFCFFNEQKQKKLINILATESENWRDFDDRLTHWCLQELTRNIPKRWEFIQQHRVELARREGFETVFEAVSAANSMSKNLNSVGTARFEAMGIGVLYAAMVELMELSQINSNKKPLTTGETQ